jgi:hypothetical protein
MNPWKKIVHQNSQRRSSILCTSDQPPPVSNTSRILVLVLSAETLLSHAEISRSTRRYLLAHVVQLPEKPSQNRVHIDYLTVQMYDKDPRTGKFVEPNLESKTQGFRQTRCQNVGTHIACTGRCLWVRHSQPCQQFSRVSVDTPPGSVIIQEKKTYVLEALLSVPQTKEMNLEHTNCVAS